MNNLPRVVMQRRPDRDILIASPTPNPLHRYATLLAVRILLIINTDDFSGVLGQQIELLLLGSVIITIIVGLRLHGR